MKKKRLILFISALQLFLFCSCIDERTNAVAATGDHLVSFSIRVPGSGTPKIRSLVESDENAVDNIVLLLFDASDRYTYQPVYINNITTDAGNSAVKTFTARVPEGAYGSMVILANSNQIVGNTLSGISAGDAKTSVMEQLKLTNAGKWNSSPASGGYIPIPMWGEITGITVGSATPAQSITMVRMVSKIDVTLSTASQARFKLKSVRLYNYYNQGQAVPAAGNWDAAHSIVTAPTVPGSAAKPNPAADNPLVYEGTSITTPDVSCIDEIYTFESGAGSASSFGANTCLLIGGIYGSDTQATYYRVDFANTSVGVTTYLPLLRNHRYIVTIADVDGPGLSSPETAFNSRQVNITATIAAWDEGGLAGVDVGQYKLTVSSGTFDFDKPADSKPLSVFTDYPVGWTVDGIVDGAGSSISWLTTALSSGGANATTAVTVSVAANAVDGPSRTGYIHLKAGNLTYVVTVNQNGIFLPSPHHGWAGSNIYWDGSKLTFDDKGVTTHQYYQGVYFQWGSLWGISPMGVWSTAANQIVYKPKADGTGYQTTTGAWNSWPQITDNITANRNHAYLYEITDGSTGLGDICKYLTDIGVAPGSGTKKWRMPTSNEFETAWNYTSSGTWSAVNSSANSASGIWENSNKPGKTWSGAFFPASGSRGHSDGSLGSVGYGGYYWSGSPSGTNGYSLLFDHINMSPSLNYNRPYGFSVRCVQE
jgi:uncharacterized protein (TIGR02145 family)